MAKIYLFFLLSATACRAAGDDAVAVLRGTWVLQQAGSLEELRRLRASPLEPALRTPGVRGFCLRAPWKAVDADFSLYEAGLELARAHGLQFSVRFMAGRHTPGRVFAAGSPFYRTVGGEPVPAPVLPDGSSNRVFEREYDRFVGRLAAWCRSKGIRLMHLAWYGQEWAELNHGREVRSLPGYTYENWLRAHYRLLDIGLKHSGPDLSVEFPFSGHGPLTDAARALADYVVERLGPWNPRFFCQANGWGPAGDWGAPNAETEAAFDRVWERPVFRGQQMIQPEDYDWEACYRRLYENRATYCEVYAASFTLARRDALAAQIRAFAEQGARPAAVVPEAK